jgi:hypothetical protein
MIIKLCITGNNFSGNFLDCLVNTISYAKSKDWQLHIHRAESNNIYYVLNNVVNGQFIKGEYQKPFEEEYDYIIWIDSDIVWNPEQIEQLIKTEGDIVTGLYIMTGNKNYFTCIEKINIVDALETGHCKYLHRSEITNEIKEVDMGAMGFMKVNKGVFEKISYPWFYQDGLDIEYGLISPDIIFFNKAKEHGFKVWVNQNIIVGHEKKIILR